MKVWRRSVMKLKRTLAGCKSDNNNNPNNKNKNNNNNNNMKNNVGGAWRPVSGSKNSYKHSPSYILLLARYVPYVAKRSI